MNPLSWIVFGLIVGSLAYLLDPRASGGIFSSIILGIVGAMVGGFLGNAIFGVGVSGFNLSSFVVAIGGSLLVLAAQRMFLRSY